MKETTGFPLRGRALLFAAVLSALVFAAYANTFRAPFEFDDEHQILLNPAVRDIGNVPRFFVDGSLASCQRDCRLYRPVTLSSFAVNFAISGYKVWSYHLFNLLLHIANSLLVFALYRRLLHGRVHVEYESMAAAAVFALHPVQTAAVTYISGRAIMLAVFFVLLSFHFYLAYLREQKARFAAGAVVFYVFGLLSKEPAVALLGIIFFHDLILGKGSKYPAARRYPVYLALAAVTGAYVIVKKFIQGIVAFSETAYGTGDYLLSQSKVLLMYLRLLFLPVNMNADHDLPLTRAADLSVLAGAAVFLLLVFVIYRFRDSVPLVCFLTGWSIAALAPEHSFVPIRDIAVEYRLYPVFAAFSGLAVILASKLLGGSGARLKATAAVLAAALFVTMSFARNRVWADETTFWGDAASKSPHSVRVQMNYGEHLFKNKRYDESISALGKALSNHPARSAEYYLRINLGNCYFEKGMAGEAFAQYDEAAGLFPEKPDAYYLAGIVFMDSGDLEKAGAMAAKAAQLDPESERAHILLAMVYSSEGYADKAVGEAKIAISINPESFKARYTLSGVYKELGMRDEALAAAKEALLYATENNLSIIKVIR